MKIVMLEPLGVAENVLMEAARPLTEAGHEFVPCFEKLSDEEIKDAEVALTVMDGNVVYAR